jgi:hypothetical protein
MCRELLNLAEIPEIRYSPREKVWRALYVDKALNKVAGWTTVLLRQALRVVGARTIRSNALKSP